MKTRVIMLLSLILLSCSTDDTVISFNDPVYYPPNNSDTWETISIESLGWDSARLQPLLDFLDERNTKSFIMLYNGRIVIEAYMNGQTPEAAWYWASAGKTLTTATVGIAQDEGLLDINSPVSTYLGNGWTSATTEQENLISVRNLLTMTSGLDDSVGDGTEPEDLLYTADAGTRWAYHNVYKKLQDVVAETSSETWSSYFNTNLRDRIGMEGNWFQLNDFNVYWSTARSMARFGLLSSTLGNWNNEQIIPAEYFNESVNTSQNLNQSYGYMWWLNGKESYRLPQTQLEFEGPLIPNAPQDMYAALGRNDQKIYVVPSQKLVIIRMGDAADEDNFALSDFDDQLWIQINSLTN